MPALLLLVLLGAAAAGVAEEMCYARNQYPYLRFGTKTAYEFVYERRKTENIPNCQPVQVWILARHGTRYPKRPEIQNLTDVTQLRDQIIRNVEQNRDDRHLCWEDIENLKRWSFTVRMDQESLLTSQGRDDMKYLAMRLQTRYPGLLEKPYTIDQYQFRYTVKERTKQSAEVFSRAMFKHSSIHFPQPTQNDTVLRPYDNCPTWRRQVDENPETYKEMHLFDAGPDMQSVIRNVSNRLGFHYNLNINQISNMYDMCRYDKAWEVQKLSPWCAVFSNRELQLLEYRDDLMYYYYAGYGNQMNVKLGCPPVRDMLQHFMKVEETDNSGPRQPLGVFYFTHSTTLLQALSQLGIARDPEHLRHDNYPVMARRLWKTSEIGPFASNLVAVLYRCTEGEKYRVMFSVAERLVHYEGCDVGLCSWQYIKDKLAHVIAGCELGFCNQGGNTGTTLHFLLPSLALAGAVLVLRALLL